METDLTLRNQIAAAGVAYHQQYSHQLSEDATRQLSDMLQIQAAREEAGRRRRKVEEAAAAAADVEARRLARVRVRPIVSEAQAEAMAQAIEKALMKENVGGMKFNAEAALRGRSGWPVVGMSHFSTVACEATFNLVTFLQQDSRALRT